MLNYAPFHCALAKNYKENYENKYYIYIYISKVVFIVYQINFLSMYIYVLFSFVVFIFAKIILTPTKTSLFVQYDVYGSLFGLLAAHPVTPLISLHHLDIVEPVFPNVTRLQALQRLTVPMKLDSAGLMQQSICYDKSRTWTVSVSWGYAVQIFRGLFSPREIEMPARTFLNWYKKADYTAYAFNTRPVTRNPCQKPFVFYLSNARLDPEVNSSVSEYLRHRVPHPHCKWKMANPGDLDYVIVHKPLDPNLWDRVRAPFYVLWLYFVMDYANKFLNGKQLAIFNNYF